MISLVSQPLVIRIHKLVSEGKEAKSDKPNQIRTGWIFNIVIEQKNG